MNALGLPDQNNINLMKITLLQINPKQLWEEE